MSKQHRTDMDTRLDVILHKQMQPTHWHIKAAVPVIDLDVMPLLLELLRVMSPEEAAAAIRRIADAWGIELELTL